MHVYLTFCLSSWPHICFAGQNIHIINYIWSVQSYELVEKNDVYFQFAKENPQSAFIPLKYSVTWTCRKNYVYFQFTKENSQSAFIPLKYSITWTCRKIMFIFSLRKKTHSLLLFLWSTQSLELVEKMMFIFSLQKKTHSLVLFLVSVFVASACCFAYSCPPVSLSLESLSGLHIAVRLSLCLSLSLESLSSAFLRTVIIVVLLIIYLYRLMDQQHHLQPLSIFSTWLGILFSACY